MMFRPLFFVLPLIFFQQLAHCSPYNNKILHHSVYKVDDNDIKIVNVNIERHEHGDFVRIWEYFNGGTEYKGRRCIVRNDENIRAGLYFAINFNKSLKKLPNGLTINIYALIGRSFVPEKFEFKLPNERKKFTAEVYCGITSKRIDDLKINAWKIELIDSDGNIISNLRSHVWPRDL
ncbi:MAG: hypothetical protein LBS87_03530 [Puniceicoccales bacterium]|jgi:hypothetical protein|nr:hypothetical protein [Puniceicoccales bacterium]